MLIRVERNNTSCACLSSEPAPAASDEAVDTRDAVEPCTTTTKASKLIFL